MARIDDRAAEEFDNSFGYHECHVDEIHGSMEPLESAQAQFLSACSTLCQSPIEQLLLSNLVWVWSAAARPPGVIVTAGDVRTHPSKITIVPQHRLLGCRVDFAVLFNAKNGAGLVAVECDGHDFHERTKEQAARDRSRDRTFLLAGIPLLRFTGSEIWRDPYACARQISSLIEDRVLASYGYSSEFARG